MKNMLESWDLFTADTHCEPCGTCLQSEVAKKVLDHVDSSFHRATRRFTCSEEQMDNLEWKLHLRFARALKEVADFTARAIEKKEKSKEPGLSASRLAEIDREIEVCKHDRAQSLKRAKFGEFLSE